MNWDTLWQGLRESAAATGMIYVMIMGALIFTYFLNLGRVPEAFVGWIAHLDIAAAGDRGGAAVRLSGARRGVRRDFRDADHIAPGASGDPEAWACHDAGHVSRYGGGVVGIINVVIIELGMIIPPIGIIVFILHGLAPQIPIRTIYRGVTPFIIADLILLALLTLFPAISTWLPTVLPS